MKEESDALSVAVESGVSVVSFDVDGTLYDMRAMKRQLRWALLRRPLRGVLDLRRLLRLRHAMEAVRRAGGDLSGLSLPWPRDELAPLEERWYGAAIARAGPRPGLEALLERVAALGLRVVALSDHPAAFKLRALGLEDRFERVFVGEELGFLKPSPRPFQLVAEALGVDPGAVLHVGDRPETDGSGARAAGCQAWILRPGEDPSRL